MKKPRYPQINHDNKILIPLIAGKIFLLSFIISYNFVTARPYVQSVSFIILFNTWRPIPNDRLIADEIFRPNFFDENVDLLVEISLRFFMDIRLIKKNQHCSDQCRQKKNHRHTSYWRTLYYANILRKWYIGRMPLGDITAECTKYGGTKTRNKATI